MQVVLEQREHEAEVGRDRRLAGEQQLDPLLDLEVLGVDVVVERDHLVRELVILRAHRLDRSAERAQDELALGPQRQLERVQLLLEADARHRPRLAHPNRPVT